MLNPSKADEATDDPTIRRCIGFARSWGFGSLAVGNLFAYRATYPDELCASPDPVGSENDYWLTTDSSGSNWTASCSRRPEIEGFSGNPSTVSFTGVSRLQEVSYLTVAAWGN